MVDRRLVAGTRVMGCAKGPDPGKLAASTAADAEVKRSSATLLDPRTTSRPRPVIEPQPGLPLFVSNEAKRKQSIRGCCGQRGRRRWRGFAHRCLSPRTGATVPISLA